MILEWYRTHGYNFVAVSDHNTLAEGEKWVGVLDGTRTSMDAFNRYHERFGTDWVEERWSGDTLLVRLRTVEEYRHLFTMPGGVGEPS